MKICTFLGRTRFLSRQRIDISTKVQYHFYLIVIFLCLSFVSVVICDADQAVNYIVGHPMATANFLYELHPRKLFPG